MPLVDGDPVLFNGATLWLDVVRVPPAGTWEHRRADIYAASRDVARSASSRSTRGAIPSRATSGPSARRRWRTS